jgi:5-methylcytosine-specific restriction endonuclease McrA
MIEKRPLVLLRVRDCVSGCNGDYQRFLRLWRESSNVLAAHSANEAALALWHQRQVRKQKFMYDIHPRLRTVVLEESGWLCSYCGSEADSVDHVLPRSRGGTSKRTNLVAACRKCNSQKGAKTPEQWREALLKKRSIARQEADHLDVVLGRLTAHD